MITPIAVIGLGAAVAQLMGLATHEPQVRQDCVGGVVVAYASEDPGQTDLDCDLHPPQTLTVIFDEVSWGDHESWGGDASLAWATEQALDMGCTPEWQATVYLVGRDCDY